MSSPYINMILLRELRISPLVLAIFGTFTGALVGALFTYTIHKSQVGLLIASAAGMMAGCGLVLLEEAFYRFGVTSALSSCLAGIALMKVIDIFCEKCLLPKTFRFSGLSGNQAIRVFVMLMGLILHSVGEGLSLGLSATESSSSGAVVALSLALHNIPETAALLFSYHSKGVSLVSAAVLAILSNLPQSIVAIPSMTVFSHNSRLMEYGLGMSAGCMAFAVVEDVFPEAVASLGTRRSLSVAAMTGAFVVLFDIYSHIHIR